MSQVKHDAMHIPDILALHAKWHPTSIVLSDGIRDITWSEFDQVTNKIAHGLNHDGFKPGDTIGVLMSNSIEMLYILFGIAKAGCCSVPLNISVENEALLNMARDANTSLICVSADHAGRITDKNIKEIIVNYTNSFSDTLLDWLPDESGPPSYAFSAQNAMNIIYSSGTTGLPKGIIATFEGRKNWAYDLALEYGFNQRSKTLIATGLYSNISWATMLSTLITGGTVVIAPNKFDAAQTIERIHKQKITHTAMVPVQYQRLMELEAINDTNFASIECAITVGAPMHVDLKKQVHQALSSNLFEIYGLTEGIITIMRGYEMPEHWTAAGKPLLGSDIAILSEEDTLMPIGETGEIIGKSSFMMPGYHARPDATTEAFWIDNNGEKWLRTGDIGYIGADGYLEIVDRKKDMILSGGQNIYPADIETVLLNHPCVSEAAVVGIPSKKWGETPLAVIVSSKNSILNINDLRGDINNQLGRQQRISYIELIEELPRNPNGKILKRELRETYRDKYHE
jgi:acyl-CoA synthetase (AMP-forming)/AMP-acid ligase II